MFWVLFCTGIAYLIVSLPLIYSVIFVHRSAVLAKLWWFTPNQFLFMTFVFPFAVYSTLVTVTLLFTRVGPLLPVDYLLKPAYEHWIVVMLGAWSLIAFLTSGAYFVNPMSIDKLQPQYAVKALQSAAEIRNQVDSITKEGREDFRENLIREAQKKSDSIPIPEDPVEREIFLQGLPATEFMQVVQNPDRQLRLKLVEPTVHTLNVVQIFVTLYIAFVALISVIFCIHLTHGLDPQAPYAGDVDRAINSLTFALTLFAIYSVCYLQHRVDIEYLVGRKIGLTPDILTMIAVVLLTIALIWTSRNLPGFTLVRFVPIAVIAVGFIAQGIVPDRMRQLIGSDTNWAIQIVLVVIFGSLALTTSVLIWARK